MERNPLQGVGALAPWVPFQEGLETAFCFEGTLNGVVFLFFLEHFLCPLLKPGQVVVLGNASAHHVAGVVERIE